MNVGSVQFATLISKGSAGNVGSTNAKAGGMFGSVLASATQNSEVAQSLTKNEELGELSQIVSDLLSINDKDSLIVSLAELTGISKEELTSSLDSLSPSSSLEDWINSLDLDSAELMGTITSMLEDAGASKEQLAEVTYSNDVWTLLNTLSEFAPEMSKVVEQLMNSGSLKNQQQVSDLLTLLKSIETVLPTKDLIGWQQTSLSQLNEQISSIQKIVEPKIHAQDVKFFSILQTTVMNSTVNVSNTGQNSSEKDGANEQNQSQHLQNLGVQPIVSRNVFSLETPAARPTSQAEELLTKLQGLFKQTNFGQLNGTNRLLVKLYPEHLGQVRIELLQTNGVMTARILASTALGKQMLDSQLHQLRQSFSQQNIQVDRIDVTQAVQDPSRNDRSQQFNQQQFKGNDEQQEQHRESDSEEQQTFQEFLVEIDLEV